MVRYTYDIMIERHAQHIKSCLGQGGVLLSRGPKDKYANVARHMSKTHARANIFMTLFLGREMQLEIRIYSPHVAMRQ